jgi:MFS family permease
VPQIRFSAREHASDAVAMRVVSAPGVSAPSFSLSSIASSSYLRGEPDVTLARRASGFDRQAAVRSALNAGAVAAVLSLLPWGFIVALPLAGYLGVRLYRRRSSGLELSTGAGFKLGLLCGVFGFVIFTTLAAVLTLGSHGQDKFRTAIIDSVQRAQARYPDHQAQWLDYFTTPHGMIVFMILCLGLACGAFVLLSGLGGAISATRLQRKGPSA